jgi:hypothetical protein
MVGAPEEAPPAFAGAPASLLEAPEPDGLELPEEPAVDPELDPETDPEPEPELEFELPVETPTVTLLFGPLGLTLAPPEPQSEDAGGIGCGLRVGIGGGLTSHPGGIASAASANKSETFGARRMTFLIMFPRVRAA